MVICKEIDYYLKYAEEHPKWINKKRKLLIENIVKPILKRDDVFFDEKTYRDCLQYCKSNYYELFPFQKFIYAFAFMYVDDIPVFSKFFIKEGRGNGKDGFIVPLVNFFQTPLYGVKNYHVEIVANSESQAKDTFKVAYDMLHDNQKFKGKFSVGGLILAGGKSERPIFAYGKVVKLKNGKSRYEWYPKCKLVENSDDISTSEEKASEQTDTIKVRAYPFDSAGNIVSKVTESTAPEGLTEDKFFAKPILTDADLTTAVGA